MTFQASAHAVRLPDPAALNISSRINSALDVVDLGLQRARRPILTTKFGPQSAALLHLVSRVRPDMPVIWVDTGFNSQATLDHVNSLTEKLGLNLKRYQPRKPWEGEIPLAGFPEHEGFSEQVKLEPFRRALKDLEPDVWFTALRREQTEFRDGLSPFQSVQDGILKVCPFLDWREHDVAAYLALHGLEGNDDYQDPTKAEPHLECGIHDRL